MKFQYPTLPGYGLSWRSIQVEPIPHSGERITIGTVVKGEDQALMAAKLVLVHNLKKIYGKEFGTRIGDALELCVNAAEKFYSLNPLSSSWSPPLEGFYLGKENSTLAKDFEEGWLVSAMHSSSFSVAFDAEKAKNANKPDVTAPEDWRKRIIEAVKMSRHDFNHCFQRKVSIQGSGVPFRFDFYSENYAAHFDAISENGSLQHTLVRAQSKLWQLDRLRDGDALFRPAMCELLLETPESKTGSDEVDDFVGELKYEASKRELGLYASNSSAEAARHLIEQAA